MQKNYYSLIQNLNFLFIILFFPLLSPAQSYDIYVYDIKEGTTKKVTNLDNSGEYNASWAPNSKKIAHDVVGIPPYYQTIYVTDLQNGNSSQLTGAEGGNDAAWSPSGDKIAFDIWEYSNWYGWSQNLYTVPSGGGGRTLLRNFAGHASWNPENQNMFAYAHQYGYILTANTNSYSDNFIAYGNWPSWSPNGKYVAFNAQWPQTGIWVASVDALGVLQGQPTQLTTFGYGPTWKNNSKDIVFFGPGPTDFDVYTIPVAGGTPVKICGFPGINDYDAAYSNNGKFIAFSSFTNPPLTKTSGNGAGNINLPGKINSKNETGISLDQNFPNPFTAETKIGFSLSSASHVSINVFNNLGQKIKTLTNADYQAGHYSLTWNGRDESNKTLPTGMYLYQLRSGNTTQVKKMNLLR
jgi:Tol biopolymer transport system component